jgi:hypothetical protein
MYQMCGMEESSPHSNTDRRIRAPAGDASAAALCGKHLRTWRAWWATGPQAHRPDPQADPNWPFADVEIQ